MWSKARLTSDNIGVPDRNVSAGGAVNHGILSVDHHGRIRSSALTAEKLRTRPRCMKRAAKTQLKNDPELEKAAKQFYLVASESVEAVRAALAVKPAAAALTA